MIRLLTVLLLGALIVPAAAQGQSAGDLLAQGIRAYAVREWSWHRSTNAYLDRG